MGLFGNISHEEFAAEPFEGTAGTISVEDYVDASDAEAEIHELATEIRMDAAAMEAGSVAIVSAENLLAVEEAALEAPESITGKMVQLSYESIESIAAGLCDESALATIKAEGTSAIGFITGRAVPSVEDIDSAPVTAMELSTEGIKDFILKIIENIKMVFKKIGMAIKKLVVKVVVAMNGTEKAAKSLRDRLKDSSDTSKEGLNDKEIKLIVAKLGAVISSNGGTLPAKAAPFLTGVLKSVSTSEPTKKQLQIMQDIGELVFNGAEGNNVTVDDVQAAIELLLEQKAFAGVKFLIEFVKYLNKNSESDFNGVSKSGDVKAAYLPFRYDGLTVKTVLVQLNTKKFDKFVKKTNLKDLTGKDTPDGLFEAFSLTAPTLTLSKNVVSGLKVEMPARKDIIEVLDELVKVAKNTKGYSDDVMKSIDSLDKTTDKLAKVAKKSDLPKWVGKGVNKYAGIAKLAITNIALEAILGNVGSTKAVLTYCKVTAAKYPKK